MSGRLGTGPRPESSVFLPVWAAARATRRPPRLVRKPLFFHPRGLLQAVLGDPGACPETFDFLPERMFFLPTGARSAPVGRKNIRSGWSLGGVGSPKREMLCKRCACVCAWCGKAAWAMLGSSPGFFPPGPPVIGRRRPGCDWTRAPAAVIGRGHCRPQS